MGILLRDAGKYREAISVFENLLQHPILRDNHMALLKIHTSLEMCYESINNTSKAYFHTKKKEKLNDSIYKLKQTESILEKNYDHKIEQKDKVIHKIEKERNKLYHWTIFLFPALGLCFLVVLIIFRFYKKSQDEVKNIAEKVIKNHIVLKDKTKIYINDLLYVKAEDHYIRLFIADNKNHFVRGRLSDLETELPPNFIRIHRSYIINRNYVKSFSGDQIQLINGERIPIGRTFRKKIDN